jgi:hypothetical protein
MAPMLTCPVCEHSQGSGDECEVCGKKLVGGQSDVATATLPGLEPTILPAVEAPPERLDELETTAFEAVGDAAGEDLTGVLEPRVEGLIVSVMPLPDIERHLAEPVPDDPDQLPRAGPVVCRYCRNPAMPGDKFCAHCGMRLSRYEPVKLAAAERGELVCTDCGALGAGPRCRRCGARMATPS